MLAQLATMKSLAGLFGTPVTGSTGTQSAVMARPHVEVRPPWPQDYCLRSWKNATHMPVMIVRITVSPEKRVVAQTKVKSGQ